MRLPLVFEFRGIASSSGPTSFHFCCAFAEALPRPAFPMACPRAIVFIPPLITAASQSPAEQFAIEHQSRPGTEFRVVSTIHTPPAPLLLCIRQSDWRNSRPPLRSLLCLTRVAARCPGFHCSESSRAHCLHRALARKPEI